MTKKNELAKSKPVMADLAAAGINIDKNDVLAIAVSRGESKLTQLRVDADNAARLTDKEAAALRREIEAEGAAEAAATVATRVATLTAALATFGSTAKVTVKTAVSFTPTPGDRNHNQSTVVVYMENNNSRDIRVFDNTVPFPSERVEKVAKLFALEQEANDYKKTSVELRRKLGNIGTLERQMRARLAEEHLRGVEGGEALLGKLFEGFESSVLALPSS